MPDKENALSFIFTALAIPEVKLITTRLFEDARGYFTMPYQRSAFVEAGLDIDFVQDNVSLSTKGVLRGLHYQKEPATQGKLIMPLQGDIFDVAVDFRKGSPSFGTWVGKTLKGGTGQMMYIPPGFAHGFCVLSEEVLFTYKVTREYAPETEGGIRWDDPDLAINWPVDHPVLSPKDIQLPMLKDACCPFTYDP